MPVHYYGLSRYIPIEKKKVKDGESQQHHAVRPR